MTRYKRGDPYKLAIVVVEKQTIVDQEDDKDNVNINTDDNNVSDHASIFNLSAIESSSSDEEPFFLLYIFMIQEIGIILIENQGTFHIHTHILITISMFKLGGLWL